MLYGEAINIAPQKRVERTVFLPDSQDALGVFDRCFYLEAISDDTGIVEQAGDIFSVVSGNALEVETIKRFSITLSFFQYRKPAQAGLGPSRTRNSNRRRSS